MDIGGQEQFYLEGQISYAIPKERGCIHLYCSTQHPTEMQHLVAEALALTSNQVTVEVRRMGGGFGGKESSAASDVYKRQVTWLDASASASATRCCISVGCCVEQYSCIQLRSLGMA